MTTSDASAIVTQPSLRRSCAARASAIAVARAGKLRRLLVAALPAHLGELVGDAIGGGEIAIGDGERRPAERRVVVPRMDHERRRGEHVAGAPSRVHAAEHRAHRREEIDRLAAAEDHRQRAPRHHRFDLAEHGADRDPAGLLADARVIAVRVGLVRDDRVGVLDAIARDVAVQIVRDDERRAADHGAHGARAAASRDRAMPATPIAPCSAKYMPSSGPAARSIVTRRSSSVVEARARQRAARRRPRRQDRHRLDLVLARGDGAHEPGELGALEEAGDLGPGGRGASSASPVEVVRGLEVVQRRRDRRQRVGLLAIRANAIRFTALAYISAITLRTWRATSRRTGSFAAMPYIGADAGLRERGVRANLGEARAQVGEVALDDRRVIRGDGEVDRRRPMLAIDRPAARLEPIGDRVDIRRRRPRS